MLYVILPVIQIISTVQVTKSSKQQQQEFLSDTGQNSSLLASLVLVVAAKRSACVRVCMLNMLEAGMGG